MRALVLALALALGAPSAALAADPDPAVTLVEQAAAAYRAGRYVAAAELFVSAFELSKAPVQLRNAAKAYERAEQLDAALTAWRRYAAQPGLTDAEQGEAAAEIRAIEQRQAAARARADADAARQAADAARAEAQAAQSRAEAAQARADAVREAPPSKVGAYVLVGAGAASLVAAGAVFLHAQGRLSDLDEDLATTDGAGRITGISVEQATSERSGIESERTASAVLLGVGLAAAAGGALWWWLADAPPPVTAAVGVGPGTGTLLLQGRF